MPRRLPPLNALRAFEAAARSESFTRAATELGVSQAAVSQQVKSLEATLGLKLFARDGKRLVITSAGKQYLAVVRDALDRIAVGTDRLLRSRPSSVLTVSTSPDFGAKWLVHRLGRFTAAYAEIDLRVSTTTKQVDLIAERVDLAIRHGDGHWAGLDAVALCRERLVPVCSPKLLSGRNRIAKASDLLKLPLLRLDGWTTWSKWFEAAGVSAPARRGPVLNQASMLIDAAADGQGWRSPARRLRDGIYCMAASSCQSMWRSRSITPIGSSTRNWRPAIPKSPRFGIGCWPRLPMMSVACVSLPTKATQGRSGRTIHRAQQSRSRGRADGSR